MQNAKHGKCFLFFVPSFSKVILKESPISINFIVFRVIANYSIYKSCCMVTPKNLLYYSKFCAITVSNEQNSV